MEREGKKSGRPDPSVPLFHTAHVSVLPEAQTSKTRASTGLVLKMKRLAARDSLEIL